LLPHLERWETLTEGPSELGARYTVLWKIGSMPMGGVVEVVEFDKARDLAWINITGVTQRGRFRLREVGPSRALVTFRLAYNSDGGLLGLIADRVATRWVGRSLEESLENLRRLVPGELAAPECRWQSAAGRARTWRLPMDHEPHSAHTGSRHHGDAASSRRGAFSEPATATGSCR